MADTKQNLTKKINRIILGWSKQKGISVSKIIMFGSSVTGRKHRDSDIDIIVISKDFRNTTIFERTDLTSGVGWELVKQTKKPFDVLYFSDREWRTGNSLIINAAKKSGSVIFG